MDEADRDEPPTDRGFAVPSHHVRKSLRVARPLVPAPPEPGVAFPSPAAGATLRSILIWVLAAGSFVVSGSISGSGTSVFPIGAVTAAPLCWLLLWINRGRRERTDRLAGLVALCGVAYGIVQMMLA